MKENNNIIKLLIIKYLYKLSKLKINININGRAPNKQKSRTNLIKTI